MGKNEEKKTNFKDYVDEGLLDEIPFLRTVKSALINWNGLSEQEAIETIRTSNLEELDSLTNGTKKSMTYGIDGILEYIKNNVRGIFSISRERLLKETFGESYGRGSEYFRIDHDLLHDYEDYVYIDIDHPEEGLEEVEFHGMLHEKGSENELVLYALQKIHDGWVADNEKKFSQNGRNKQYQHLPMELIGWKEVKSDLIFLRPILEKMGVYIDDKELENAYNKRVSQFLSDKGIQTKEDLAETISKGVEFYPPLEGQENILSALSDKEYVLSTIVPQIEQKGIGNIENFTVKNAIRPESIEHATEEVRIEEYNNAARTIKEVAKGEQENTRE